MDHFDYPLCHSSTTRTRSCKDGGNELELVSFLFAASAGGPAFFDHHGIHKKNPILVGTALRTCLLATALGALGFLPDWGKDQKAVAAIRGCASKYGDLTG